MSVLLVYESMFGNTREVARAIAEGLGGEVSVVEVSAAPAVVAADVSLLIVGGPTHAFSMSRPATRVDAARQAKDGVISRRGIRDWIAEVDLPGTRPRVATFDSRVSKPSWLTGSAAKSAARHLRARGCRPATAPRSFLVVGTTGPLGDGELDQAREWGRKLREHAATRA